MGANPDGEIKRKAAKVLQDIKWLDEKVESMELDEEGWMLRYELERGLEEIYIYKESSWQKDIVKDGFYRGVLTQVFFTAFLKGERGNAPYIR
jgi:hypothetical protein